MSSYETTKNGVTVQVPDKDHCWELKVYYKCECLVYDESSDISRHKIVVVKKNNHKGPCLPGRCKRKSSSVTLLSNCWRCEAWELGITPNYITMSDSTITPSTATSKLNTASNAPATSTSNKTKTTSTSTGNPTTSTKDTSKGNSSKNNTTASDATTSNTAATTTSTTGSTTIANGPSSSASAPAYKSASFPTSQTIHSHSSQAKTPTPAATTSASTTVTTTTITQLQIPSSQSANAELARQVPNHQKYLCYELPAYHICGHASGETSLLLSQRHAQAVGYGAACTGDCAVDSSRRAVLSSRCGACAGAVAECLAVALKHGCGHLAGVQVSAGTRHGGLLGAGQQCDAYCRAVQVDVEVGGACRQCTWSHCCMVWGKCRCGHRDGVVAARVLSAQHVLNFGTSRAPCDARCHFRHKDRVVGDYCAKCKPLVTPMSVAAPVMEPPLPLPLPPIVDPTPEPREELRPPSPPRRARIGIPRGAPRRMYYENMRW
ncbi:hypothetical protein F4775DRAFT_606134 [Biscogniauxia sp. FL1348]|nr:hypothetical protein F4775DRAFT_606134 [Biscogniauxia sp. FL1348]